MHVYPRTKTLVVGAACVATLAIGGLAYANSPDSNGVIQACYATNGTGALNVIDPKNADGSVPKSCVKGQAALSFQSELTGGFDINDIAFIVMMSATKDMDKDLHQILDGVEKTNSQKQAMHNAVSQLIRSARLLNAHQGTVAGYLHAAS